MSGLKNDLPTGWVSTRLGELYNFEYGKSLTKGSRAEAGRYPVYGSSGIVGTHDQFLIEGPAIIVGRKGAAGSVHYSTDNSWPIDTTYYVRGDKNLCLKFSYYLFRSLNLAKLEASTAIPGLNRNHAYDETVPLPPLPEQHRIVAKIEELFSELDKGIENLKAARAQLKVYRQALLKHAFEGKLTAQWRAENQDQLETAAALLKRVQQERAQRYQQQLADCEASGKQGSKPKTPKSLPPFIPEELAELPELPEGWEWARLASIVTVISGYAFKSGDFVSTGVPVVKIANVGYSEFIDKDQEYLDGSFMQTQKDFLISPDDFLLALTRPITNNRTKVCRYPKDAPLALLNQRVSAMKDAEFNHEFLYSYFGTSFFKESIRSKFSETLQPNLSPKDLEACPIPICALAEQGQIFNEIESRLSLADQLDQTLTTALQQAEALRQSILKKAFSGQLVAQDPHDEPASALLARIQAERADVAAKPRKRSVGDRLSPTE